MKSPTLTSREVRLLIDNARDAEICRDPALLGHLLSQVWDDKDLDPDYSRFEPEINAELLRLTGVRISEQGRGRGLIDQQIRAKNILTRSADIFANIGNRNKYAETSIALANCYWFSGEVEEYNAILCSLETEFVCNQSIFLRIQLNRIAYLNWQRDYEKAITVIDAINVRVHDFPDQKLKAQFYNNAGIIYRKVHSYKNSIYHLHQAVEIAKVIKSHRFQGLSMNCLAMTFREIGDYNSAHNCATEAISVFESIDATGWVPHVLDTRALIFLDQEEFEEALETINKAISLFTEGEDYSGLTEAMFTKCRCLLRLARLPEAFALFWELGQIASFRIGETALKKYCGMLAGEVRFIGGNTFRERTDYLKKQLLREALRVSEGNISKAAETIGESHQALSFMLKSKFPELYDEFGIKRKSRAANPPVEKIALPEDEPPVQHVMMPKTMKFAYDFHVEEATVISTFLISADLTIKMGLMGQKLVAVAKIGELKTDVPVLFEKRDDNGHDIGRLFYDKFTKLYVIHVEENDEFVFPADVSVVGVPIGYCDVESVNREMLRFKRINFH